MSDEDRQSFSGWMRNENGNSGCALFFILILLLIVCPFLIILGVLAHEAPNSPPGRNSITSVGDIVLGVFVVVTLLMIWQHVSKK